MRFFPGLVVLFVSGCFLSSGASGPTDVTMQFVDSKTQQPMKSTLVAFEVGGRYLPIADTSKGNPHYTISAVTDANGKVTLHVPGGPLGVHSFQDNYFYGTVLVDPYLHPGDTIIPVEPLGPLDTKPAVGSFAASAATVAPGGSLDFSAQVTQATFTDTKRKDPISDEVLLVEPTTHFARAFDPPSAGVQSMGFPDGVWKTRVSVPSVPGKYTYSLIISSEGCIVSDRKSIDVLVQ